MLACELNLHEFVGRTSVVGFIVRHDFRSFENVVTYIALRPRLYFLFLSAAFTKIFDNRPIVYIHRHESSSACCKQLGLTWTRAGCLLPGDDPLVRSLEHPRRMQTPASRFEAT